ncbi:hypothetical protein U1Q18_027488 [Sarracenia purpurea var. burkii]
MGKNKSGEDSRVSATDSSSEKGSREYKERAGQHAFIKEGISNEDGRNELERFIGENTSNIGVFSEKLTEDLQKSRAGPNMQYGKIIQGNTNSRQGNEEAIQGSPKAQGIIV